MDFHMRLQVLLQDEKIHLVEEKLGFSSGSIRKVLKNKMSISSERLEKMFQAYPHWNPTWLLTGRGEMYDGVDHEADLRQLIESQAETIKTQARTIELADRVIETHDLVLDKYKRDLEDCEENSHSKK